LDAGRDDGPVPPLEVLARLKATAADLDVKSRSLAADALTLRFAPQTSGIVARLIADGEPSTPRPLAPGEILDGQAVGSLRLEIEGVGTVEIGRTSPERAAQQADLERSRRAFDSDLRAWKAD